MGLEYQTRAWLYVANEDQFELDEDHQEGWHVTGNKGRFYHWSADGKSLAFYAVKQFIDHLPTLRSSRGFVSMCADCCDVGLGFDRGYWLRDELSEINLRQESLLTLPNDGLRDHFSFCRAISYSTNGLSDFLSQYSTFEPSSSVELPVAGWFYLRRQKPEFASVGDLFEPQSITIGQTYAWDDFYVFYGDIAPVASVVESFQKLSERFPFGAGLISPIYPRGFDQFAVFRGRAYQLFRITESEVAFHSPVQFSTCRHGYGPS